MNYTFDNFHKSTFAVFKGCKRPKRTPDYTSHNKQGEISSEYWYGENNKGKYIIRYSTHWSNLNNSNKNDISCGNIKSCYWQLQVPNVRGEKELFKVRNHDDEVLIINVNAKSCCGKQYLSNFKGRG